MHMRIVKPRQQHAAAQIDDPRPGPDPRFYFLIVAEGSDTAIDDGQCLDPGPVIVHGVDATVEGDDVGACRQRPSGSGRVRGAVRRRRAGCQQEENCRQQGWPRGMVFAVHGRCLVTAEERESARTLWRRPAPDEESLSVSWRRQQLLALRPSAGA